MRAGNNESRCPFHRAGLSPLRRRRALAQLRMDSMRPRKREAVSGLLFQIGWSTRTTCSVSTRATFILPITGSAYIASVLTHCSACLAFFQPARCDSMYWAAHQANVTVFACSMRVAAKASCLAFIGSAPARTCLRHAMALSRASTSETSGYGPSPVQRSRPAIVYRKIQDLEPPAVTFNQSPAPSPCMPASLIRLTCNCVNLFAFTIRLSSTEMEAHFALVIRNRIRKKQKIVRYSMSQLETNKIITHCFLLKKL